MSTAAHEPRRVGQRRTESPSGAKVTPRRNAPEEGEPLGLQYDSDELPVLIRLPNLRDLGTVEQPSASRSPKNGRRTDRAIAGRQKTSPPDASKATKKPIAREPRRGNKLLLGGIVGGILVVVVLFWFNAGSPQPPTDQDGWASEADGLETPDQGLDITFATGNVPPPLFDENLEADTAKFASGEFETPELHVPLLGTAPGPQQPNTAALPNHKLPVEAWPSEAAMGLQAPAGPAPVDLWPGESMSQEQGQHQYAPANSPGSTDYRSSKYPSETESFRMGKLNADRPLATEGERGSILDGNIEIPDTTSLR